MNIKIPLPGFNIESLPPKKEMPNRVLISQKGDPDKNFWMVEGDSLTISIPLEIAGKVFATKEVTLFIERIK